jgi:hypothetical protein
MLSLGQYIFKINFGIDELLSMDIGTFIIIPFTGRPASTTVFFVFYYMVFTNYFYAVFKMGVEYF